MWRLQEDDKDSQAFGVIMSMAAVVKDSSTFVNQGVEPASMVGEKIEYLQNKVSSLLL